ncbi:FAD-binding oxidoreductase [Desulfonatronovibrio magnus]|uniref:FAD-binding oxidoreductase n=1 Tax=Desulfonatronovibrio magnus TaxID=698827 RepID=UPI0005EB9233|nr:FAD-linked oxidase C-terminal domain-containing protein [Desulfonatronovibrio magnus]
MATQGLSKSQLRLLADIFPGDSMTVNRADMMIYGVDASREFALPWAVVRPESVTQIQELMRMAGKDRIPIYPRARGTNVVGCCTPVRGGIVLSCLRMNKVLSMDEGDFSALVEPGVITFDLQQQAASKGLFYPPDPASVRTSTIGGNISTNAGGMRAVKYGVTKDYILGIDAVLPGGKLISTGGRVHKNVVGLDLTGLITGSEGTLAVIVSAWVKLLPLPEHSVSILICFKSDLEAVEGARNIFRAGILPCAMEFMPRNVLRCLSGHGSVPWPPKTVSALIVRLDGSRQAVEHEAGRVQALHENVLYMDKASKDDQERIWEMRRLINPASYSLGPDKISDDVVVPRGRVLKAVQKIEKISAAQGVEILAFGHIGDGNLHVNIMHDASDPAQRQAAINARSAILEMVLEQGGSISGEHGVGLKKRSFISRQIGPVEQKIMQDIKNVFDPQNIMNPGKVF